MLLLVLEFLLLRCEAFRLPLPPNVSHVFCLSILPQDLSETLSIFFCNGKRNIYLDLFKSFQAFPFIEVYNSHFL